VDRRAPIAVLTGLIVAVLFVAVATGGEVQLADGAPSFARDSTPAAPVTTIAPVTAAEADGSLPAPLELPAFVEVMARIFFYGCLVVFGIIVLSFAWRHRPNLRVRRPRRPEAVEFDALDDVADAISADADAQRSALQRGAPRNAIVECWLRLEATVVDAGVARYPSDTSAEFTHRALATVSVDPVAIADLAALYREARFSSHTMDEDSRRAAIAALEAVHNGLRSGRRTIVTSP
jgi:heme A synthase